MAVYAVFTAVTCPLCRSMCPESIVSFTIPILVQNRRLCYLRHHRHHSLAFDWLSSPPPSDPYQIVIHPSAPHWGDIRHGPWQDEGDCSLSQSQGHHATTVPACKYRYPWWRWRFRQPGHGSPYQAVWKLEPISLRTAVLSVDPSISSCAYFGLGRCFPIGMIYRGSGIQGQCLCSFDCPIPLTRYHVG